nr:pentatricopeptide repeat-containing protein At3g16610 [Ipomoea batatas]GMD38360.1 pentatricopeptide repeat-containing protein At3g16610 [Ipomoea batatas]
MIRAYAWDGPLEGAVELYYEMMKCGVRPTKYTYPFVLKACSGLQDLENGVRIHEDAERQGFGNDVYVCTALVDFYVKCGCLVDAREVFDGMRERDTVAWNALIAGCSLHGLYGDMRSLVLEMQKAGLDANSSTMVAMLPAIGEANKLREGKGVHGHCLRRGFVGDLMVSNTLLSMYAKCGRIDDAMRLFEDMHLIDSVSYSAIISGCVQNGNAEEALRFFQKMQHSRVAPDLSTMMGFLPACSQLAALQYGVCGHGYSIVHGFTTDVSICNALIDMYSKCGKVELARLVFERMYTRDVVSWNAMISGYGIHGRGREAILVFNDMLNVGRKPDEITFISLLFACSHSGLVAEGKHWFHTMCEEFKIVPRMDHYLCMVDLLGRADLLDEAYSLVQAMPFEPDVRIWSALLAACRIHRNIELAEEVSNKIHSLGPESPGNFVLLSNLYSTAGRWDDAAHIRIVQKDSGFKKSPGCSWVEVNGNVHAFVGGDQSHPQSAKINEKLNELYFEMKKLGYRSEFDFVYQDVEEEEKEQILLYHSEKLAVAFALLNLKPSKPILVTKNLRVCVDCHTALKYITTITKREITVRDASRFHHFRDGVCSCKDFW